MNQPHKIETDHDADSLQFLEQVVRYQDGTLTPDELAQLKQELLAHDSKRQRFIELQLHSAMAHELLRRQAYFQMESPVTAAGEPGRLPKSLWIGWGTLAACAVLFAVWIWSYSGVSGIDPVAVTTPVIETPPEMPVLLAEASQASFVGHATASTGDALILNRDYMLVGGFVKLAFPRGATAILEAPAKFHIRDSDSLALEVGNCSVHAPAGAEGFRVVTPVLDIIDRGTRFSVKVNEISETEVHVIEGAADLLPLEGSDDVEAIGITEANPMEPVRLTERQARRLDSVGVPLGQPAPFNPSSYRHQLPDRIISYQATRTEKGAADELLDVTVQRGGRQYTYSIDELIPIEVTRFRTDEIPDRHGHLLGDRVRPERPQDWLEDRKLNTGLINFGGQTAAPDVAFIAQQLANGDTDQVPGLGIRFRSPVVNGPGPDLVLFDVQTISNPLEGDPFHVCPVEFRPGIKACTIRQFDLTLASPESLQVNDFWLHRFPESVNSLSALATAPAELTGGSNRTRFRAYAVGIDLSDLGYAEGEQVEELLLQHASAGGKSKVDPVLIAGFPNVSSDAASLPQQSHQDQ